MRARAKTGLCSKVRSFSLNAIFITQMYRKPVLLQQSHLASGGSYPWVLLIPQLLLGQLPPLHINHKLHLSPGEDAWSEFEVLILIQHPQLSNTWAERAMGLFFCLFNTMVSKSTFEKASCIFSPFLNITTIKSLKHFGLKIPLFFHFSCGDACSQS